jgi:hypothetical protein
MGREPPVSRDAVQQPSYAAPRAGTIANAEPNLDHGPALRMNQRFAEGTRTQSQSVSKAESPRLDRCEGDLDHTLEFDFGSVPSLRQKFEICVIESPTGRYGSVTTFGVNNVRCDA